MDRCGGTRGRISFERDEPDKFRKRSGASPAALHGVAAFKAPPMLGKEGVRELVRQEEGELIAAR